MKFVNRTTYKMVLIEFFVILVGILSSVWIFSQNKQAFDEYETLFAECINNQNSMQCIENMLRLEQIYTCDFIMSEDKNQMLIHEQQRNLNRERLFSTLEQFSKEMEKREQKYLFFQLKTICNEIFEKSDIAFRIKKNQDRNTAIYFYTEAQKEFSGSTNAYLEKLNNYVNDEIERAKNHIESQKKKVHVIIIGISIILGISIIVSIIAACRLTKELEDKKFNLEIEVREKNFQVSAQNLKLIEIQRDTIYGMANLIELRNGETGEHVKRTSQYVDLIAKKLREKCFYTEILTDKYISLLDKAAPMHDVGKIMIPDSILAKPGKLTEEEFEIMKKHAAEGGRIVRDVLGKLEDSDYVEIASNVASFHHEKWNGAGYPQKLSGEKIPLCARIMAIADVFDALVSTRCYKAPMPPDVAFDIIKDSSGSHFDPTIAQVFLEMKDEVLSILNSTS